MASSSGKVGSLRTQDPIEYTTRGWFPINIPLLKEIQAKIRGGIYENDREGLILSIKQDFSLFGYCLRKVGLIAPIELRKGNPVDVLRKIEWKAFKECLNVPADEISIHVVDPSMKTQASRIRHLIVSCSAAEIFAEEKDLDVEVMFSCAFARQLGYALIAYNYPRIYTQALSALKKDGDQFDQALRKVLGISPLQLGVACSVPWTENLALQIGMNAVEIDALEDKNASNQPAILEGSNMKRLCEVGESLARLNDPEHFPSSAKRWHEMSAEIDSLIGPDGLALINARVRAVEGKYTALSATLFKSEIAPERAIIAEARQFSKKLLQENQYIKECGATLQKHFNKVYDSVRLGEPSKEGVQILVMDVIPLSGFIGGCIYLADLKRMKLVPTVRIGDIDIGKLKVLNLADEGEKRHPAVDAIGSMSPIRQENVVMNDKVVSHVTGTFGNNEKSGVLFLEMGPELLSQRRELSLLVFKAIRQSLNDCLSIKTV